MERDLFEHYQAKYALLLAAFAGQRKILIEDLCGGAP